jgi:hypothetical protein
VDAAQLRDKIERGGFDNPSVADLFKSMDELTL